MLRYTDLAALIQMAKAALGHQDRSRNVLEIALQRGVETGAKSRAAARHQRIKVDGLRKNE